MAERTGTAIRKLRASRGWTLSDLSAKSGIPISTLSRLELGQGGINNDKAARLCQALDVEAEDLLERAPPAAPTISGRRSVVRAGDGALVQVGRNSGRLAAADLRMRGLTPVLLDVTSTRPGRDARARHEGEAYLLVLDGAVELHSELYAPLPLAAGDGVYFDATAGYELVAPGGAARVLLVAAGDAAFAGATG